MRICKMLREHPRERVLQEVLFALGYREDDELPDTTPIEDLLEELMTSTEIGPENLVVIGHLKLDWLFLAHSASVFKLRDVACFRRNEEWDRLHIEASPGLEDGYSELIWKMTEERMTELLKRKHKGPISLKGLEPGKLSGAIMVEGGGLLELGCVLADYLIENGLMEEKPLEDHLVELARGYHRNFGLDPDDPLNDMRRELYTSWAQFREIMDWRGRMAWAYARKKQQAHDAT